jgi:UDP-N-acetylmuramyl tripeptide synthase
MRHRPGAGRARARYRDITTSDMFDIETKKYFAVVDRKEAITKAVSIAEPHDVIVVAGKGHEKYQEINGVKNHFDDIEELKKLL